MIGNKLYSVSWASCVLYNGRDVFFNLSDTSHFSGCPQSVKMRLGQESLIERPTGLVNLTCEVTGALLDDVAYIVWSMDDTNAILYTYSVMQYILILLHQSND